MPWVSKKLTTCFLSDPIRCMRCGRLLDSMETEEVIKPNQIPCCDMCWPEVNAELTLNRFPYPADWYGHAWQDCEFAWHVEIDR